MGLCTGCSQSPQNCPCLTNAIIFKTQGVPPTVISSVLAFIMLGFLWHLWASHNGDHTSVSSKSPRPSVRSGAEKALKSICWMNKQKECEGGNRSTPCYSELTNALRILYYCCSCFLIMKVICAVYKKCYRYQSYHVWSPKLHPLYSRKKTSLVLRNNYAEFRKHSPPYLYIDTLKNKMFKRQREMEREKLRQTDFLPSRQIDETHTVLWLVLFYSHYHDNLSLLKIYHFLVKGWTIFYKMDLFKRYKQILIHVGYLTYFVLFFFYCSGFCPTLKWISHGFTCVPHPDPPSHLPFHPIPLVYSFFNVKISLDILVVFILRHQLFFFLGWAMSS